MLRNALHPRCSRKVTCHHLLTLGHGHGLHASRRHTSEANGLRLHLVELLHLLELLRTRVWRHLIGRRIVKSVHSVQALHGVLQRHGLGWWVIAKHRRKIVYRRALRYVTTVRVEPSKAHAELALSVEFSLVDHAALLARVEGESCSETLLKMVAHRDLE